MKTINTRVFVQRRKLQTGTVLSKYFLKVSQRYYQEVTKQAYAHLVPPSLLSVISLAVAHVRHDVSHCHWTSCSFGAVSCLFS